MRKFTISLSNSDFQGLNARFPPTSKSSNVGDRAIQILRIHFLSLDGGTTFREQVDDADLEVTNSRREVQRMEVKGTADNGIAWQKLKVSGKPSHAALLAGMPLYRVTEVYAQQPVVYVLQHQEDFTMEPEPRWAIKKRAP
jgi:hypothetical protein